MLMCGELEFGICCGCCHDAFVHHLVILMSPSFLVQPSDELLTLDEFFLIIEPYFSSDLLGAL